MHPLRGFTMVPEHYQLQNQNNLFTRWKAPYFFGGEGSFSIVCSGVQNVKIPKSHIFGVGRDPFLTFVLESKTVKIHIFGGRESGVLFQLLFLSSKVPFFGGGPFSYISRGGSLIVILSPKPENPNSRGGGGCWPYPKLLCHPKLFWPNMIWFPWRS